MLTASCRRADAIRAAFQEFGEVKDVYLPKDYYTKQPRGFAYVEFHSEDTALDAMDAMNNR